MALDDKNLSLGREQTDQSLRQERQKTDRALAVAQTAVKEDADLVVQRARENADAVLIDARDKADQQTADDAPRSTVVRNRAREDETLRDERAAADQILQRERDENALLTKLLPLERDKTDRYLLTERARSDDAVSHRDDFLGIVSHDLRNLLGGIVMSAALLAKGAPENEEGTGILAGAKRIQRYAARMNRLIGDLVDVASIDSGKLAMTPAPGDWTKLVVEAADMFQAAASVRGISLETLTVEGPALAEFDHDRMLQVLANLITNSIKFTAQGGKIWVRSERVGNDLRFSVGDTGPGIPENMLEAIFARFWQVGKNDQRGLGLGLYISRCIVEAHRGRIWAESKLGEGSVFSFTLPGGTRPDLPLSH